LDAAKSHTTQPLCSSEDLLPVKSAHECAHSPGSMTVPTLRPSRGVSRCTTCGHWWFWHKGTRPGRCEREGCACPAFAAEPDDASKDRPPKKDKPQPDGPASSGHE
jgi:hypothetical protein